MLTMMQGTKKRKKKKRYQPILGTLHAEIGETAGNIILEI
jgi:hypothetical protein